MHRFIFSVSRNRSTTKLKESHDSNVEGDRQKRTKSREANLIQCIYRVYIVYTICIINVYMYRVYSVYIGS